MPFFDFHIHPVLKSQFSENTANTQKFSPWDRVRTQDIPLALKWCTEFEYILESQASLSQLAGNDCNLICAVLYIAEQGLIDNDMVSAATKTKLNRYLQQPRINEIIAGNPYTMLMNDDLSTLTNPVQFGVNDRFVKMLKRRSDYNQADTQTVHVVFTLEGFHSLSDGLRNFNIQKITDNLEDLRKKITLISVNPTHIEQSPICNHAFAMPYMDDEIFRPTGRNISKDGIDLIAQCYKNNILIDLKHMSLGARRQLYDLRNLPGTFANIPPLVCTHAGFTGISMNEIPDYMYGFDRLRGKKYFHAVHAKPVKFDDGRARPCFNPISLNLYDEDILAIINSGGMIGLSMDKRILGYEPDESGDKPLYPLEEEYFASAEQNFFIPDGANTQISNMVNDINCMTWEDVKNAGDVMPNAGFQHLRHFMGHLLHLVNITGANAAQALKQVCIGSDFDGIINPVWCCETTDELYQFRQDMHDYFVGFANACGVALPAGFDIDTFCEDLFFNNGKEFVMKRLDILNP